MPARFRILPSFGPMAGGAPHGATGPLAPRDVDIADGVDEIRVGRRADLELPLPFPSLSGVHAHLRRAAGTWSIEDAGSTNGTWLGDERLVLGQRRPFTRGTELRFGNVRLRFEGDVAPGGRADGTGTIARRLVDDLFGGAGGAVPTLRITDGAPPRHLALTELGRPYVVGRADGCALPLPVAEVSREHATLVRDADGVRLRDLGSKNGVVIKGARVSGERRLADGDVLQMGPVVLAFADPVDRYLRELAGPPAASPQAPPAPPEKPPAPPEVTPAPPTLPPPAAEAPVIEAPPVLEAPDATGLRASTTPRIALLVGVAALLALVATAVALTFF